MEKLTKSEKIDRVTACFPEGMREDPTVIKAIERVAGMTKKALALACSDLLPAEFPSKREAERGGDVEAMRGQFSSLLAITFLGHKPAHTTTEAEAAELLSGASEWARAIEINRIEAKALAAAERVGPLPEPKGPTVTTLDGRKITRDQAAIEIAARAGELIQDHEKTHGKILDHERTQAARIARSEIVGMTQDEIKTISAAEAKRARKASRRLAEARAFAN